MKINEALNDIHNEACRAAKLYPSFVSYHEGYAVLKEEVDELWDEIKKSKPGANSEKIKKEAIQVGAMALRFLVDLC